MKRVFISFGLIILIACFNSCEKPGCLGKAGPVTTVTIPLTSFNEIILEDNINLLLTQGDEDKMEITGPGNILPSITGKVTTSILTISNTAGCRWARNPDEKINVHLYFKTLQKIDYRGSGNITNTDTLRLDALQITTETGAGNIELTVNNRYTGSYILQESADIILHGKSETCYTYTNARGYTDMSDFTVKKMIIEYGGLNDTYVNVTGEMNVIIYYKGNIYYRGNPVITRATYYGSGSLIHAQ